MTIAHALAWMQWPVLAITVLAFIVVMRASWRSFATNHSKEHSIDR